MAYTTRQSLLARVRAGDEVSWSEFYATYRPLIWLCGRDHNLSYHEIEELIQQVMTEIFQRDIIGKYNPDKSTDEPVFKFDSSKGKFRAFLRGVIHRQALRLYCMRNSRVSSLDDDQHPVPLPNEFDTNWEEKWEEEWKMHILNEALTELRDRVQAETYVAFEMYALQQRPLQEVTKFLNCSASSVYTAKNRCLELLKKIISTLEEK